MSSHPAALDAASVLSHSRFLRTLAHGLLRDPGKADDVVQQTWQAALECPERAGSAAPSWWAALARNFALRELRTEKRVRTREGRAARPEAVPSTGEIAEREGVRRQVVEALLALPGSYREVLILRFYEELPPRRAAQRLGVPVETVRTRTRRGLELLRAELDRRHGGERALWAAALFPVLARPPASAWRAGGIAASAALLLCAAAFLFLRGQEAALPPAAATASAAGLKASVAPPPAPPVAQPAHAAQEARVAVPAPPEPAPELDGVRGVVVDAHGQALSGALVFFGTEIRMRGDEPFKPYQPQRIRDGVTSAADGSFLLNGKGRWITAWHADWSPVSLLAEQAQRIVLPARGSIRGRLLDRDGAPMPGVKLRLDRDVEALTDAGGRFAFERVPAGPRGLEVSVQTGPKRWLLVRLAPGQALEVDVPSGLPEARIRLVEGMQPWEGDDEAVLLGLDVVTSLAPCEWSASAGATIVPPGLLPGRYLLLAQGSWQAPLDIRAPEGLTADIGACALTVRAPAQARVYVVPAGSDALVQLMGGRVGSRMVDETGAVRFAPLPAGRYDVGVDREGIFATVEVTDTAAVVALPEILYCER